MKTLKQREHLRKLENQRSHALQKQNSTANQLYALRARNKALSSSMKTATEMASKLDGQYVALKCLLTESGTRLSAGDADLKQLKETFFSCQHTKNAIKWSLAALLEMQEGLQAQLMVVRAKHDQEALENETATRTLQVLKSEFEENSKLLFQNRSKRDSTQLQVYNNKMEIAQVEDTLRNCNEQIKVWELKLGSVDAMMDAEKETFGQKISEVSFELFKFKDKKKSLLDDLRTVMPLLFDGGSSDQQLERGPDELILQGTLSTAGSQLERKVKKVAALEATIDGLEQESKIAEHCEAMTTALEQHQDLVKQDKRISRELESAYSDGGIEKLRCANAKIASSEASLQKNVSLLNAEMHENDDHLTSLNKISHMIDDNKSIRDRIYKADRSKAKLMDDSLTYEQEVASIVDEFESLRAFSDKIQRPIFESGKTNEIDEMLLLIVASNNSRQNPSLSQSPARRNQVRKRSRPSSSLVAATSIISDNETVGEEDDDRDLTQPYQDDGEVFDDYDYEEEDEEKDYNMEITGVEAEKDEGSDRRASKHHSAKFQKTSMGKRSVASAPVPAPVTRKVVKIGCRRLRKSTKTIAREAKMPSKQVVVAQAQISSQEDEIDIDAVANSRQEKLAQKNKLKVRRQPAIARKKHGGRKSRGGKPQDDLQELQDEQEQQRQQKQQQKQQQQKQQQQKQQQQQPQKVQKRGRIARKKKQQIVTTPNKAPSNTPAFGSPFAFDDV